MLARSNFIKGLCVAAAVWGLSLSAAAQDQCFERNAAYVAEAQIICNDPGLRNVDQRLFERLRSFAAVVPNRHAAEFQALGGEWLNERSKCKDIACMQEFYTRTVPIWFDLIKMMTGEEA